jgi:uncharacterized membrane protein YgcG
MTMLKLLLIAGFWTSLFCSISLWAEPIINTYDSFITVKPDSTLVVEEKINITTEGKVIQHGIYRDFPTRYQSPNGEVTIQFAVKNAELDGLATPYLVKDLSNGVRVYLGDKQHYLAPGTYTFSLTYTAFGELGYFNDHDELYWNVTGNGWNYPILKATAVVKLPDGAFEHITGYTAYTGFQGGQEHNYQATKDPAEQTITFVTTRALEANQGLTLVLGWKKGFVKERSFFMAPNHFLLLIMFLGLLLLLIYYYWIWRKYGKDGLARVIIPEYEPPPGYTPAALRYILKMGYDKKVLASAVLNLAVKGYFKINETKHLFSKTYTLIKQPDFNKTLSSEEQIVVNSFFSEGDTLELKQQAKLEEMKDNFVSDLEKNYEDKYFVSNVIYSLLGMAISLVIFGFMALLNRDLWGCFWLLPFLFVVPLFVDPLDSDSPLRKIKIVLGLLLYFGLFVGVATAISEPIFGTKTWMYSVLFLMIILTNLIFAYLLKRPTPAGQKVIEHTKGFKIFLNATEKDRLNFHNPPDHTPELFEQYLPYALALGVEQKWAEQFSTILEKANYQPQWYIGSGIPFYNSTDFTSSLSNSLSNAISSSTTAPGSSSGFGGGGSSGGGGGGGGGGGW